MFESRSADNVTKLNWVTPELVDSKNTERNKQLMTLIVWHMFQSNFAGQTSMEVT